MSTVLSIIILLHGIINLLGFAKVFNLAELKELSVNISKQNGLFWLIAGIFLIFGGLLLSFELSYWWVLAFIGAIISQIMIFKFWKFAKFGTIINFIIIVASGIGYANFDFNKQVNNEVKIILSQSNNNRKEILTKEKIFHLPNSIQKWITSSGAIDKSIIENVRLEQKAFMKMSHEQKDWSEAKAIQYFTTESPALIWKVKMNMAAGLNVVGRDKFLNGKGSMLIKLLGIVPLVDSKNNTKLNEGSLQRYLAEIVWFPTAAASDYISWQAIDDTTAKATITVKETSASGIFHFNKDSSFNSFTTMRYFGGEENSEKKEWIVSAEDYKIFNGIKIPYKVKAVWKLETGNWEWLKLEITEINYNSIK
ncbi:MAG: hypothetical protein CR986_01085 [Ignavibacteriae bacterium]|nr:MAG: hypothetical protein CR986_01085 [Ignavibacteriota bacterium]